MKKLITKTTLAELNKAFTLLKFQYCSSVWHFRGVRNAEKLENLDKRILRYIIGDFESTYNIPLSEVNCVSLYNRHTCTYTIC